MPRDYAHRGRKKSSKFSRRQSAARKGTIRRFFWRLILLIVLFALLFGVMTTIISNREPFLKLISTHFSKTTQSKKPAVKKESSQKEEKSPAENQVNFEFYKMLPRISVEVYNDQESTESHATKQVNQAKSVFILQLASIQDADEAVAFKRRLSDLGYPARIVEVQRGDIVWHRVQLGPYKELKSAEEVSDQLLKQGINSILLRLTDNVDHRTQ